MRFFSSPSVGLWAAGVVVASGCSLIASPDEDLLNGSGGDPSTSSSGTTLPSASSSGSPSSSSSSSSASSGGGEGGGPVSSSASQGGGGTGGVGGTGGDGGAGGAGGAGGQGGGVGGQGGQGGGPACVDPAEDCAPTGNECIRAICDAGVCATENVEQGTETTLGQAAGDCRVVVCDGEGDTEEIDDDDDTPAIDPDACIASVTCVDGAPVPVFESEGTACGPDGDLTCDAAGECQGCTVESQCPGDDNPCSVVICDLSGPSGVCARDNEVAGTVVDDPDENCQRLVCNDDPVVPVPVPENDDTDFIDDDNDCTLDECDNGTPTNEALDPGDACDFAGTVGANDGVCNGTDEADACVQCLVDNDCGDNDLCETNNCDLTDNTCDATVFIGTGIEVADPVNNDCRHTECDGAGNPILNDPEAAGTTCNVSGGTQCDANGNCLTGFCDGPEDCPADNACRDFSCNLGTNQCTFTTLIADGGLVGVDTTTDCNDLRCAAGVPTLQPDNTETPPQDGNICTAETCSGGSILSTPANEGQVVLPDAPDDCVENACLNGVSTPRNDNTETPPQDGNVCTIESCSAGGIVSANGNEDGACSPPAGGECNAGTCVECDADNDCNTDTDCVDFSCNGSNACVAANQPLNTPCDDGGGVACNGSGVCGAYTFVSETFDGLPATGTSDFATFEAALTSGAWQLLSGSTTTRTGNGSANSGGIYSFVGTPTTDRALGGVSSGTALNQGWGICFTNASGSAINTVTVNYNGEQWRDGGNNPAVAQALSFSVSTFVTTATLEANVRLDPTGDRTTGWENVATLGFSSPVFVNTTTGAAVDGNTAGRVAVSGAITGLTLANGASACVRWLDVNDPGNDHGLGIDDLVITGL